MLFIPTASECALGKCGHWYMNMGLKRSNEVRIGKLTLTTDKYMHFQKVKQKGVLLLEFWVIEKPQDKLPCKITKANWQSLK